LNAADLRKRAIERSSEQLVHGRGLVALDKIRFVAIAVQQIRQLLSADPSKHGGVGDLEPVQMEDRQHRAVARRVQEFVGVPARASAPVSASPSPTIQATIKSGLSNAAQ